MTTVALEATRTAQMLTLRQAGRESVAPIYNEMPGETEGGVYIVQLEGEPLATYAGTVRGFAATSPAVLGTRKLDVNSPASRAYEQHLADQQSQFIAAVAGTLRHAPDVRFQYRHAYNGVAIFLSPAEAAEVARLDGVVQLYREGFDELLTDIGPAFIGAEAIWNAAGGGSQGEGLIVGILDTGINSTHPSFAATGGDGYVHTNPWGTGTYVGYCADNPSFCNDKLIGAWNYQNASAAPEDVDGHGSHTASTVAGNYLEDPQLVAPTATYGFPSASGVAPHANIIAYRVCYPSCPGSATTAAVNQAVIDGVDVTNYSISGGTNPYVDSTAVAFRNAVAAGILPSNSAGNSGPTVATVGHRGAWVMTVAASTHERAVLNSVVDLSNSSGSFPDIQGESAAAGVGPAPLVYAGDAPYNNPLCNPFPAGTFTNEIVVCDRGTIGRVEKGQNVLNAGGVGMILLNDAASAASLNADTHVLPATHVSYADGVALKAWMAAGTGSTGRITGGSVDYDAAYGDAMASFSSRGPAGANTSANTNIIKPDITAPGLNILAAYHAGFSTAPEFNIISGTSMSSPHAAGAATLVRAMRPEWTPPEVKSAMMMTGATTVTKEDGVTPADPFDFGAGRVNLEDAVNVGFVLNITNDEFVAANPSSGGDLKTLNLASLASNSCAGACTWTRTLRSVLDVEQTYEVSVNTPAGVAGWAYPSSFVLAPGATQVITLGLDVTGATLGSWAFGDVTIEADTGDVPDARFPIAVIPAAGTAGATVVVDPATLSATLAPNATTDLALAIGNTGNILLDWAIDEAASSCASPGAVSWLSVAPAGGSAVPGGESDVVVTLDSTGLSAGTHEALLCVESNDPATPLVEVPVSLEVEEDAGGTCDIVQFDDVNLSFAANGIGSSVQWSTGDTCDCDTSPYNFNVWQTSGQFGFYWPLNASGDGGVASGSTYSVLNPGDLVSGASTYLATTTATATVNWQGGVDGYLGFRFTNPDTSQVNYGYARITTTAGNGYPVTLHSYAFNSAGDPIEVGETCDVGGGDPAIEVDPSSLSSTLAAGASEQQTLTIGNVGESTLDWTISEASSATIVLSTGETVPAQGSAGVSASNGAPASAGTVVTPSGPMAPRGGAPIDLVVDDGSRENGIGLTAGGEFIWLNRFTPAASDYPFTLNEVQLFFGSVDSVVVGEAIDIYVYSDADGDPSNGATFVGSLTGQTITALDTFVSYPVSFDLSGPGDVLIAVVNRDSVAAGQYPAALDQTASQGRSWVGIGTLADPPVLPTATFATIDSVGFAGNWMVRGVGTGSGPGPVGCDAPEDIGWLSVSDATGSTPAGESSEVTVTFDATGLAADTYEATLCVASNDPATPLVEVPVTLTVEAGGGGGDNELLVVDLSVADQLTITATSGVSLVDATGGTGTGFYFEDLLADAGTQAIGTTTYDGTPTLTAASVAPDGTPALWRTGSSDPGLNVYSYSATATTTFTVDEVAFSGTATWNITPELYAALLTAPATGNVRFPADDVADLATAATLGTYRVILPGGGGGDPVIDATPDGFDFTVSSGGSDSDTLAISNIGGGTLTWEIDTAEPSDHAQAGEVVVTLQRPASAARSLGVDHRSGSQAPAVAAQTFTYGISPRGGDPVSVLLVTPDTTPAANLVNDLNSFPDVTASLYTGTLSTLTAAELTAFDVVVVNNDNTWVDAGAQVSVGDALADYVDAGGKVMLFNFAYDFFGWELGGRFMTEGYGPFQQATSDSTAAVTMVVDDPAHPILSGVGSIAGNEGFFRLGVSVQAGAHLVASWSNGFPFVAVNDDSVAINMLYGDNAGGWTGDLPLLTYNAVTWLADGSGGPGPVGCDNPSTIGWLDVAPGAGSTGAGATSDVSLTVDASGLAPDVYGALLCLASNDTAGNELIEIPVTLTVEAVSGDVVISVDPTALVASQSTDTVQTQTLTIRNDGTQTGTWDILETTAGGGRGGPEELYDNGPMITDPGAGAGGADVSAIQLPGTLYGAGAQQTLGNRVAEDFTVTGSAGWDVDTITFYSYQTGSTTASTITGVTVQIWDGVPGEAGSTVVWGDTTTNVLGSTTWTSIYRTTAAALTDSTRPIMAVVANTPVHLPAGTYWVDYAFSGTLASGPWANPVAVAGQTTTGNALQSLEGAAFTPLLDNGSGAQIALPFKVVGTGEGGGGGCTASDVPWLSVSPASGTTAGGGGESEVTVEFDSTGLATGDYHANLCVLSDDSVGNEEITVPVTLTVVEGTGGSDLGLGLISVPSTVAAGGDVSLVAHVANFGPANASDVTVELELPAAFTFVSGRLIQGSGNWTCAATGGTVTCELATGELPVNSFAAVLQVDVDVADDAESGTVQTEGTVSASNGTDPNPGNDTAVADTTIEGVVDGIFCDGFEDGGDGSCGGAGPGPGDPDIVVFDGIDFTVPATLAGGSVRWDTGETCECDTSPFNFNIWTSGGNASFYWPITVDSGGVAVGGLYAVLASGAEIGPDATFITDLGAAAAANWRQAGNVDGYLGFRFVNPATSQINYGYARITTTGTTGHPATIVSWAYNAAGDPITIP